LDGERHLLALLGASFLEGCSRADGSIKGYIVSFALCRAGLDVAASLSLGMGARTTPGMMAG